MVPKLQISKEKSIFTKSFTVLRGWHKWELELEEWTKRAKQVKVVVFPMCNVLRKLSILCFLHIYYTLFLQSRAPYRKHVHLLMIRSTIQDYVSSRWFFIYSVDYAPTPGAVNGDLDLIRRLPFVKPSTSNTCFFLSGHHLFTDVQDYYFFFCLCVFRSDKALYFHSFLLQVNKDPKNIII